MPPTNKPFPHLPLILRYDGPARSGKPPHGDPRTRLAKENRSGHGGGLTNSAANASAAWRLRFEDRERANLPVLPKNVPLVLEVDTSLDLDELRKNFGFELVSEQEDGYVIVASEDLDLSLFLKKLQDFIAQVKGSATVAAIYRLEDDPDQSKRLSRILSERLLSEWPTLAENGDYIVDVGIACSGQIQIPPQPGAPKRNHRWSDMTWAKRQGEHATKMKDWTEQRNAAYMAWQDLADARYNEVSAIVNFYGGSILSQSDKPHTDTALADSFTLRIRLNGKGLRDLVLNYSFIFEVVEPDDVSLPQVLREAVARDKESVTLVPPPPNAPAVCVVDSGLQHEHYLLEPAVDRDAAFCFLPGASPTDVADYVRPGGHGTRVAGAILYGESIPRSGSYELACWLQNARVLDAECRLPDRLFPPALLNELIRRFHEGPRRTRIFNHSITASAACRTRHMSAWAAEIDQLSHLHDVLFVVSSGNLYSSGTAAIPGVRQHLVAGRTHPDYLCEAACRVANPAQSLQALTVGSISYREFEDPDWLSCARQAHHPSAFSRSGLGIWNTIKPEVVEFGGDNLVSRNTPPDVGTPPCGRECYPELVRSTMHSPGPAYERDVAGTSFAAPKVSRIAAHLQDVLPDESCLLYRALIVQSARWPGWTRNATPAEQGNIIRWIGYGVPDIERASSNTEHRTTLVTSGDRTIKARGCHIYQVPIDAEIRRPGSDYDVLVEVTLSYSAEPRRTRRNRRRYLSTWLDWKSSNQGEPLEAFRRRAIKTETEDEGAGAPFAWVVGSSANHGTVRGVSRSAGTVQKDWAIVKSNALPEDFCIAVVGHEGWSKDPDSAATYTLAVSVEMVGKEIPIYERLRVSVDNLRAEVEVETEVEAEIEALG
ncbi:Subtilase family protein [Gemmata obscuriglobus]|uniref:Protease n=1 Tax=Gemmata obscuriglobus TaxID=114 RepID=A0A2Z3H9P7_9BACT|nr:S8 family peptidase [Gemmata obscuriglobus]AWM40257.1 protease [Gemmata obscuriglobus]QEG26544.1 Subtilase family protein [Gemmata obscuriglobus]VTS01919.1 subtilase family protease : Protease OS=Rhodopirellula baltica SWK14 GN=RBSWK_06055 PE=4 SV=1: Peptidase_S8 [Gemmata obscuriglobus UQM 2246]